jgi:hypothetical protein
LTLRKPTSLSLFKSWYPGSDGARIGKTIFTLVDIEKKKIFKATSQFQSCMYDTMLLKRVDNHKNEKEGGGGVSS